MKIVDLSFLLPNSTPSSRIDSPKGGEEKFAACLQEAVAGRQQESGVQALGGPAPLAGVAPTESTGAAQEMVDAVLSRLELFQEALSRPGLNLKSLFPLVQALEKDSQHLDSLAGSLPDDSPLRQIVQEAAALTWTEGCKFNRGDYV